MSNFTQRFERLEFKYLVDEMTTADIRRQIAPYCLPDEHSSQEATEVTRTRMSVVAPRGATIVQPKVLCI